MLGMSGHMYTGVSREAHSVTVRCTSRDDPSLTAESTVSGLLFLEIALSLEQFATTITVLYDLNIPATCECQLDDEGYVFCKLILLWDVFTHFFVR